MYDSIWYNYIHAKVFNALRKELKKKYTDLFFTTEDQNGNPPSFPTLYLHEIESPLMYDLTHKSVIGMNHYMRLEIFTNTTNDDCKDIRAEAIDYLVKRYGYTVTLMPITSSTGVHWGIATLHRVIGGDDIDFQ